jgi:arsenate reductase-like glutaredoxin family protein
MIQIFGTLKNRDTQKAVRYFKERRVAHQFVDLAERSLSRGELESVAKSVPLEELIDREGVEYKKRGLEHMEFDIAEILLENPLLLCMPVVRDKNRSTTGYAPEVWETWL